MPPRTEKGFLSAEFSYSPSVKITRMNWMNINKHMNHYEPMVHNCLALFSHIISRVHQLWPLTNWSPPSPALPAWLARNARCLGKLSMERPSQSYEHRVTTPYGPMGWDIHAYINILCVYYIYIYNNKYNYKYIYMCVYIYYICIVWLYNIRVKDI